MKKYLSTIITASAILIVGGVILLPQIAQAQLIDFIAPSVFNNVVSWLGNRLLTLTSWAVTIGGLFLSISMNITLHIKELYQAIPAIESTWVTIRDLSSIFIIFMLLYSAIVMILGVKGPAFGKLVLNIFIAGILINFSLFFVRVAVDASNLVSLQFYNAIAPKATQGWTIENAYYDGGLSNIFMQSLKIPKIYNNKGWLKDADTTGAIVLATYGGAILMITAAFSFFAAAIAFTIRTGLLIFVMALSPLFFVGIIFPQIQAQVSSKLLGILKNQLIFMPVYLGLMYVALRFISDEGFLKIFNTSALNPELSSVTGFTMAGIVIQYTIAALFINAPLIAAISFGAWGAKWAPDARSIGKMFGGLVGRNTLGRAGGALGKSFDTMAANYQGSAGGRAASSVLRTLGISQAVRGQFSSMEKGKYGGSQTNSDIKKENKERERYVSGVRRGQVQVAAIGAVVGSNVPPSAAQMKIFRDEVDKMGNKDFENMDFKTLSNPIFASNLSSKQAESLLDSEIFTQKEKDDFKKARKDQLITVFNSGVSNDIKEHMKKLSGKELSKFDHAQLTKNEVIDHLTPSQLQEMRDIDNTIKAAIGNRINGLPTNTSHKAKGYIRKNLAEWQ